MSIDFITLEEARQIGDINFHYPFQSLAYQTLFLSHFSKPSDEFFFARVQDERDMFLFGFEIVKDIALLIGMKPVLNGQEITDFGSFSKTKGAALSASHLSALHQALYKNKKISEIHYDYIPENTDFFTSLQSITQETAVLQEVSPTINLPDSWELYLDSLERTDRKELKRKWKRLESVSHEFMVINTTKQNIYFDIFVNLHRRSDQSKAIFMTNPMEQFFKDLLTLQISGWQQKLAFLNIEDSPAAAVFYFESDTTILLYNSGFDPRQKYYSGGLLLISFLIRDAIKRKKNVFDFLRGNERYKYDLGGKDTHLYRYVFHSAST